MDLLGLHLSTEGAVTLLAVLGTFLGVLGIGLEVARRMRPSARLKAVRERREQLKREAAPRPNAAQKLKKPSLARTLMARLGAKPAAALEALNHKLTRAGWRGRLEVFLLMHVVLVALLGGMAFVIAYKGKFHISPGLKPLLVGVAVVLGAALPSILLKNATVKRQQTLTRQFPDALDLLLVCVEAGLSVDAAFARVTEEIDNAAPEIAVEMGITGAELAFLGDRRAALDNLHDRTGLQEFKSLTTTLIQSERYGTPVAQSLRVLSEESRRDRVVKVEKKAAALPVKLTLPIILCFLPVVMMIIIGPAIIQL